MIKKIYALVFMLVLSICNISFAAITESQEQAFFGVMKDFIYHPGYIYGFSKSATEKCIQNAQVYVQNPYDENVIKDKLVKMRAIQQRIDGLKGRIPNVLYLDLYNGAASVNSNYEKLDRIAKDANINKKIKQSDLYKLINITNSNANVKAQLMYDYMCLKQNVTENEMFVDDAVYRDFQIGMTYPELLEECPIPGTTYSTNIVNGEYVEVIRWPSNGNTYVYGTFKNNVLVSKSIK